MTGASELTAEMIEAGRRALARHWLDIVAESEPMPLSEVARLVYLEMEETRLLSDA
jgi:hypothetical protein